MVGELKFGSLVFGWAAWLPPHSHHQSCIITPITSFFTSSWRGNGSSSYHVILFNILHQKQAGHAKRFLVMGLIGSRLELFLFSSFLGYLSPHLVSVIWILFFGYTPFHVLRFLLCTTSVLLSSSFALRAVLCTALVCIACTLFLLIFGLFLVAYQQGTTSIRFFVCEIFIDGILGTWGIIIIIHHLHWERDGTLAELPAIGTLLMGIIIIDLGFSSYFSSRSVLGCCVRGGMR